MKKIISCLSLGVLLAFTTSHVAQNATDSAQGHIDQILKNYNISQQDAVYEITDQHISSISNVEHVYFRQVLNGLQIYGTESDVHILPNGKIISENTNFLKEVASRSNGGASPSLNAIQAVQAAASQLNYNISEALTIISSLNTPNQETLISDGGISITPIPAKLMYQLNQKEQLVLVWDLSIQENSRQDWWNVRIDAASGQIVDQNNFMLSCSLEHDHSEMDHPVLEGPLNRMDAIANSPTNLDGSEESMLVGSYRVYAMPVESPYHGARTLEVDPNSSASPFGWHDTDGNAGAESTLTTGNNVDAHKGSDRPDGTAALIFDFPIDLTQNPASNTAPYITNLFYWNNIIHDVCYVYGFDEVSGNFQENNYGNGGLGSDFVDANAQANGNCNANFGTPPDGGNPTMNMYMCTNTSPPQDGDLDNGVIAHEYAHGISNRLTGGPSNVGCLNNSEQMGEGWSDYFGMVMTIEPGDQGTDYRGMGTYLFGQGLGGPGIRPYPYSTDFAINPQTYDDICGLPVPHGVGSVWATILWEVTWALIDTHGFDPDIYNFTGDVSLDAGNIQAIALVMEGMKLQPCSPGFIDGRDAIFAADLAIYGGANECLLWDAFAIRGLGASAVQGSPGSTCDGVEAFDSPVPAINTADEVCVSQGLQVYGGGTPIGGVYSGPGVTDDGNGLTYTFDPAAAGIGVHSIGYDVTTQCASGTAFDTLEVITDVPEILCQDITLELDANGEATLTMYDIVTNLEPGALTVDQTGTFAPIDITATGTSVSLTDDSVSSSLSIGFDFSFYGTVYTNFWISSNGFISFASTNSGCCTGGILPDSSDENNLIALAWEDLNPSSGGTIRYETIGVAPDRKLIVEYDAVPFYGTSDLVTTQAHLFEGSNRIEIHSTSIPSNGPTTQGIENANGTEGLPTPGRNSQVWSATNDYVAYYYAPGGPADNCGNTTTITLSQELFTCADLGTNTVTVTITDTAGNTNTCTPTVTIIDPLEVCLLGVGDSELYNYIVLFPNPTHGIITLENRTTTQLLSAVITDVNGRKIQTVDLSNSGVSTDISVEALATGLYFIEINTATTSIVKRIVKQ